MACDAGWPVGSVKMQKFSDSFNYLGLAVVVNTGLGSLYTHVCAVHIYLLCANPVALRCLAVWELRHNALSAILDASAPGAENYST